MESSQTDQPVKNHAILQPKPVKSKWYYVGLGAVTSLGLATLIIVWPLGLSALATSILCAVGAAFTVLGLSLMAIVYNKNKSNEDFIKLRTNYCEYFNKTQGLIDCFKKVTKRVEEKDVLIDRLSEGIRIQDEMIKDQKAENKELKEEIEKKNNILRW